MESDRRERDLLVRTKDFARRAEEMENEKWKMMARCGICACGRLGEMENGEWRM
jgi:hypothetical protein